MAYGGKGLKDVEGLVFIEVKSRGIRARRAQGLGFRA